MAPANFLTPDVDERAVPVRRWLELQVDLLRRGVAAGAPEAAAVMRFAGINEGEPVDEGAARLAVAKDHWYADWASAVAGGDQLVDSWFEACADAVHVGDIERLHALLDADPSLVAMRSPFPHRQTLLHHVAANGIEAERQLRTPANAVDVMRLLLERGAEPDAGCDSYGGGNGATTLCLLVSSAGPAAAGVQAALVAALVRGGARVNGVDDDGLPLRTAITFGYTDAAEALVRCGARVDNLCFAAALGDLEAVRGYVGREVAPDISEALIWATAHGRRAVVEYLLTLRPDLTIREPSFGATALGMARYYRRDDLVALLEPLTPA